MSSIRNTGVISARDPTDWDALVCFAPYAFDATVWAADGELASLADERTSLVVHLSSDQGQSSSPLTVASVWCQ